MASGAPPIDDPLPGVRRLTVNRVEKRNALNNALRGAVFETLVRADGDESVRVTITRRSGPASRAGYDLSADIAEGRACRSAGGIWPWSRHVVEGWLRMWDLANPIFAQIHGHCLAGASELAAACDLEDPFTPSRVALHLPK